MDSQTIFSLTLLPYAIKVENIILCVSRKYFCLLLRKNKMYSLTYSLGIKYLLNPLNMKKNFV